MHKVSHVLAERFSQDPLETYFWFCKQHPPGALKDTYHSIILFVPTRIETKKYSNQ